MSTAVLASIEAILGEEQVDLLRLRRVAREAGGYQNHETRRKVWPKLLGINRFQTLAFADFVDPHKDHNQVQCDVDRSLWEYKPMKFWRDSYREKRRSSLSDIIMATLSRNPSLHYYQGFHDVVSVFLLVFDDDSLAFSVAETVASNYMLDYMKEDFELVCKFIHIILLIVKAADPELFQHFQSAKLEPFFATSWLLTWFAHDIKNLDDSARVFDILLASPPMFSFYLTAAYLIHIRDYLLSIEADFAMLHSAILRAPGKQGFPTDDLIPLADDLFERLPTKKLLRLCDRPLQKLISSNSIIVLAKSHFSTNTTPSDWSLLKNMNLLPAERFLYSQHGSRSWGWLRQFTLFRQKKININLTKTSTSGSTSPPQFESMLTSIVIYLRWSQIWYGQKRTMLHSALRNGLFWSITVAVGAVVGYAYWTTNK